MSDIYDDLKARASEHGFVPAFKLTQGDEPGKVVISFLYLMPEEGKPEFSRLAIYDDGMNPTAQYLVETERMRALIDNPV